MIPIYLANARMSEKSRRGYARFPAFAAACLNELSGIAAQSRADAERLQVLGAPAVAVTGNLKFDITPDPALVARGAAWREQWGRARPVLLCASTREGEEALLLQALRQLDVAGRAGPDRAAPSAALRRGCGAHRARRVRLSAAQRRSADRGDRRALCLATAWARCSRTMRRATSRSSAAACCRSARRIRLKRVRRAARSSSARIFTILPKSCSSQFDAGAAVRVDDARAAVKVACDLLRDPARAAVAWATPGLRLRAIIAAPRQGGRFFEVLKFVRHRRRFSRTCSKTSFP